MISKISGAFLLLLSARFVLTGETTLINNPSTCQFSPPADTLVRNANNVLQALLRDVMNPNIQRSRFTGKYLYTKFGAPVFATPYQVTGNAYSVVEYISTRRDKNYAIWCWESTIASAEAGSRADLLRGFRAKLDSLIQSLYYVHADNGTRGIEDLSTHLYLGSESPGVVKSPNDSLVLSLMFRQPLEFPAQPFTDSLSRSYWPSLVNPYTANIAAMNFTGELHTAGIPKDLQLSAVSSLLAKVAMRNDTAAYQFFLGIEDPDMAQDALQSLPAAHYANVSTLAKTAVAEYYRTHFPGYFEFSEQSANAVSASKTDKTAAANTVCAANKAKQQYAVNEFMYTNDYAREEARVAWFDCDNNTYIVERRRRIPARKTFFVTNSSVSSWDITVSVVDAAAMGSRYVRTGQQYSSCPVCRGTGTALADGATHDVLMVRTIGNYDYYSIEPGMTWKYRSVCGNCMGNGWIKRK